MYRFLAAVLAISFSASCGADYPFRADRVLVKKSEKILYLMKNNAPMREFRVALGPRPRGHKQQQGDERTPEGIYVLEYKNEKSDFYKSIRVSYPNSSDMQWAQENGVDPGGDIMIHGMPNNSTLPEAFVQMYNWTDGCIAVTNAEMDEIWQAVEPGTLIEILP